MGGAYNLKNILTIIGWDKYSLSNTLTIISWGQYSFRNTLTTEPIIFGLTSLKHVAHE